MPSPFRPPAASPARVLVLVAALLVAPACNGGSVGSGSPVVGPSSSGASGSSSGASGASGATSSSGSSGATSSGATSSGGSSSGASSGGGPTTEKCVGTSAKAGKQPVDIFVMLDRSPSMDDRVGTSGTTKWQAVSTAISAFVGQPLEATSVGLGYFPIENPPPTFNPSDPGSWTSWTWEPCSCKAADYAKPEVEIGPLASTAAAIRSSISAQQRVQATPTSAALQGAIDHARSWAGQAANADHAAVVILATDGDPTACDTVMSHIDGIAAAGLSGTPSVRTFVIGVGPLKANLDGIARAGGTGAAFIVDTGGAVSDQFLQALTDIRNQAVGCSYAIPAAPAGQTLVLDQVNVEYQPGGAGAPVPFSRVAAGTACGSKVDGWHYDAPGSPKSIVLCPATCDAVKADAAASVSVVLGCRSAGEW